MKSMLILVSSLWIVSSFVVTFATKDWWETATFYQIYPRSFKDSDGDGIGDLNGIREKLPYLKEIGVTAFWLSPIFKSPMKDFGYDISDFYDIQPEYGTLQDFDQLLAEAKRQGIKVILDFVPNHSSDKSDFFERSERKEAGFEDYFIWHPGKPNPNNASAPLPPNNWLSVFRFSAWKWSPIRQEYYYHLFLAEQPDLNYRNPLVVQEMKNVLKFWLERGVDGFRVDSIACMFEIPADEQGNYPDEPLSGNSWDPDSHAYLNHIYTIDWPENYDMVYQWREVLDTFRQDNGGDTRVMMTESYGSVESVMLFYGDGQRKGAQMPFNFQLLTGINNASKADDYKKIIDEWLTKMPTDSSPNWVMGNHDRSRIASRLGSNRVDAINMILSSLPGASVTYNGDEIGMIDVWISWEDTVDPQGCNTSPEVYETVSRDPVRAPLQWDGTTSAGFSTNPKTWLPVAPDFRVRNVANQLAAENSALKVFIGLQKLRQTDTLKEGSTKVAAIHENVLAILRELKDKDTYLTIVNLQNDELVLDLSKASVKVPTTLEYVLTDSSGLHQVGDRIPRSKVTLKGHEGAIFKNGAASVKHFIILWITIFSLIFMR